MPGETAGPGKASTVPTASPGATHAPTLATAAHPSGAGPRARCEIDVDRCAPLDRERGAAGCARARALGTRSRSIGDLVVNRDWVQAQILAGIARSKALSAELVFNGGSALQKVFFGASYRFSEDLDFTGLPSAPRRAALQAALRAVCDDVEKYARTGRANDSA